MLNFAKLRKKLPKTIELKNGYVEIIDQRLLPSEFKMVKIKTYQQMIKAIYSLQVRGAPAIGAAGACAVVLAANSYKGKDTSGLLKFLAKAGQEIIKTRPTAANLAWAVKKVLAESQGKTVTEIKNKAFACAQEIMKKDIEGNMKIAEFGETLIKNGSRIQTHCNAGSLATVWLGTATAPMYAAILSGKKIKVQIDETRPMLQGARLTAWEITKAGIDCQLNIDGACGYLMSHGLVDLVIVGADRIVRNGDFANKIGTFPLALMAHEYKVPFYVAATNGTIDLDTPRGKEIIIEERDGREITEDILYWKKPVAPKGLRAFNPVFDVTPAEYVTKFITEKGIFSPEDIAHSLK